MDTQDNSATQLETEHLLAAARQRTGLSDFGDPATVDALSRLVDALRREAGLSSGGMQRTAESIVATLANRLQVEDYLKSNPELLDRPIEKPLFVFGLPRTGTTLAINLLTADPARRAFLRWEAFASVPPAQAGELRSDPRYHSQQAQMELNVKYVPHIAAMHYEDADSPTECQFAMSPTFVAQVYDSQYHIPSYSDWFLHTDYMPAFRYHKRLMQLLQEHNGGRWTFKNPWHPLYLDALTTVYPDAQLVMTHRDPADVVGSACSLVYHVRKLYSDDVDPVAVGEQLLRTFDLMVERAIAYEQERGSGSIHHVQYRDLTTDPIEAVRAIYSRFEEPFTADAETAMKVLLADSPKGKHGKHEYSLEDYGLTREGIYDRFDAYIAWAKIPVRR